MKYRALAIVVCIALSVLVCVALILSFVWLWHEPSALLVALPAAGICARVIFVVWRQARAHHPQGHAVLLCRRFSSGDDAAAHRNRWLERVLLDACRDVGVVVTLRDTSIDAPQAVKLTLRPLATMSTTVLGLAGLAVLAKVLVVDLSWRGWVVFLVISVCALLILFVITRLESWLIRAIGTLGATPTEACLALRQIMNAQSSHTALMVVQSSDDAWQGHIDAMLHEVSAVVVDISSGTENITWELERALEVLGPERVLFIHETAGAQRLSCTRRATGDQQGAGGVEPFVVQYGSDWNAGQASRSTESWMRTRAAARAVRTWLVEGRPTNVNTGDVDESILARARQWTPRIYAAAAALCTVAILAPLVNPHGQPWIGVTLVAVVSVSAAALGLRWARTIVVPAAELRTPMKAAGRGVVVALATLWSILPVLVLAWSVYGLYSQVGTSAPFIDKLMDIGAGALVALLVFGIPLSVVVSVVGALLGIGVEAVLFRGNGRSAP